MTRCAWPLLYRAKGWILFTLLEWGGGTEAKIGFCCNLRLHSVCGTSRILNSPPSMCHTFIVNQPYTFILILCLSSWRVQGNIIWLFSTNMILYTNLEGQSVLVYKTIANIKRKLAIIVTVCYYILG